MIEPWIVILAGGIGSRFWPASTPERPKQLLDLFGRGSMLRMTCDRLLPLAGPERQVVVTGASLGEAIRAELPELPQENILCEPCGRNTAPAIGWAAVELLKRDPDAVMAVLPADQHIVDEDGYREVAQRAASFAAAEQRIVTLGIRPTHPETGYGYIRRGSELRDGVYSAAEFREKPDVDTARGYLADGGYLWNAGMFFAPARVLLEEIARFEPGLHEDLPALSLEELDVQYPKLKSISIDYAVAERSDRVAVIPGDFGWSDVGSWPALHAFRSPGDGSFNQGSVVEIDGEDNVLYAHGGVVAAIGVEGLVVVHTPEATLVCPRDQAQRVREVVSELQRIQEKNT